MGIWDSSIQANCQHDYQVEYFQTGPETQEMIFVCRLCGDRDDEQ